MATSKSSSKGSHPTKPNLRNSPARRADRRALIARGAFDLRDYGFAVSQEAERLFEVVPARMDDEEAFLFFFPRDDLDSGRYALFNFHAFLKRTGTVTSFARSLGASVRRIPLRKTSLLGVDGLTYSRRILMRDLFDGAPQVIEFIGGSPDLEVRDSHTYFSHRHNHYYTGLLHADRRSAYYDRLRRQLLSTISLV
jgi:hypothetical protein